VHPLWRKEDGSFYEDPAEFVSVNAEAFQPILTEAEKYGIIVLSENLLWGASIHAENISALVDAVDSPWFGWCYDTGHANAMGDSMTDLIGLKRIPVSLHIQDNHGDKRDEHLIPGDGNIDWEQFLCILKQIGYPGEFVIEAHHQTLDTEDDKRDAILEELLRRAKKMTAALETL
jgi:sugar phosphate isomerase/epimerase